MITAEYVIQNNDGIIKDKFLIDPVMVQYALNYICDEVEPNKYKLNTDKITKQIALAMLYVKGDYYLNEFVTALKHAIELALPIDQD